MLLLRTTTLLPMSGYRLRSTLLRLPSVGVGCDDCGGAGIVPAFPAQHGVDVRSVLKRRGAPPGLEIPHEENPSPRVVASTDHADAANPGDERRRPSLRDIVLSRHWRMTKRPELQTVSSRLQHHQHEPYDIQTPELLTHVLRGPRQSDLELDMPAMPLHHPIDAPPPRQARTSSNSPAMREQEWDIFSATRDDPAFGLPSIERLPYGQVRDWLERIDEDGPVPDEYRLNYTDRQGGG